MSFSAQSNQPLITKITQSFIPTKFVIYGRRCIWKWQIFAFLYTWSTLWINQNHNLFTFIHCHMRPKLIKSKTKERTSLSAFICSACNFKLKEIIPRVSEMWSTLPRGCVHAAFGLSSFPAGIVGEFRIGIVHRIIWRYKTHQPTRSARSLYIMRSDTIWKLDLNYTQCRQNAPGPVQHQLDRKLWKATTHSIIVVTCENGRFSGRITVMCRKVSSNQARRRVHLALRNNLSNWML